MDKPTEAQWKELLEWCGFKGKLDYIKDAGEREGRLVYVSPPLDLNNLFKHAVPKLKAEYRNWKSVLHDWVDELTGDCEKDALSLFWLLREHFGLGGKQ